MPPKKKAAKKTPVKQKEQLEEEEEVLQPEVKAPAAEKPVEKVQKVEPPMQDTKQGGMNSTSAKQDSSKAGDNNLISLKSSSIDQGKTPENKKIILGSNKSSTQAEPLPGVISFSNASKEVKLDKLDTTMLSLNKPVTSETENKEQPVTEEMRMKLREQRFKTGGTNAFSTTEAMDIMNQEKEKLNQRAKKFGVMTADMEEEKLQARAKRFGTDAETSGTQKAQLYTTLSNDEFAKRAERAKRFGVPIASEEEDKKRKRVERFGMADLDLEEQEKRLQRAKRFKEV